MQRGFEVEDFAIHIEFQAGHGLVEQPVPGRIGGHRFLVEQLFDSVFELIGLGLAQLGEPGPVAGEFGIGGKGRLDHVVVDAVEFELEEQHPCRQVRQRLIGIAHELGAIRIGGILRILQKGEGADPAGQIAQRLGALDRLDQLSGLGQLIELALVVRLERRPRPPWPFQDRP